MISFGTLAVGGVTLAQHGEHGKGGVRTLSQNDITEKIDGKKAMATMVEVTLGPGESSAPHRHPGPAFGYVLQGEYEWAIDDNPTRTLKAGNTFYEPTGCLHRVSRNPSMVGKTRILAVVLHPAGVKDIVIPEKEKSKSEREPRIHVVLLRIEGGVRAST
jgi:quercetin dioxygenase-like cupin family protein